VREGELQNATNVIISVAKGDPQLALTSLQAALETLGGHIVKSSGIMDSLWPWLQELVQFGEVAYMYIYTHAHVNTYMYMRKNICLL